MAEVDKSQVLCVTSRSATSQVSFPTPIGLTQSRRCMGVQEMYGVQKIGMKLGSGNERDTRFARLPEHFVPVPRCLAFEASDLAVSSLQVSKYLLTLLSGLGIISLTRMRRIEFLNLEEQDRKQCEVRSVKCEA